MIDYAHRKPKEKKQDVLKNIKLSSKLKDDFDKACAKMGVSSSKMIRSLMEKFLQETKER